MGEIVAAFSTCHAPQLITRPPDEKPEQLDASIAAMHELGKILDETKPDVIIFLGSDHLETFSLNCVPTFAIVAGSRAIAKFGGKSYDLPIHREMAEDLLNKLIAKDFDIAYSEDAELGHTFSTPFEHIIGKRDIPVIPIHMNVYMPPLPSPRRCAALGKAIAEIVKGRKERVCILASGGMSHYPGTWKYPTPEYNFDYWMISQLEAGLEIIDGGSERSVESGFIDILAKDSTGAFVVIELKSGLAKRETIGQVVGYMGDLLAEEANVSVRGIIVAAEFDKSCRSSIRVIPNLSLKRYRFSFEFEEV